MNNHVSIDKHNREINNKIELTCLAILSRYVNIIIKIKIVNVGTFGSTVNLNQYENSFNRQLISAAMQTL